MLTLTVFDPTTRRTTSLPFPSNTAKGIAKPLPGASAVHLHVTHDQDPDCLRLEIEAVEFPVDFTVSWSDSENCFQIDVGRTRPYFILPPEAVPLPPIVPSRNRLLDFLVVVDATAAALKDENALWKLQADQLAAFLAALRTTYSDLRFGFVAFADEPMGNLADAQDLTPTANFVVKGGPFASCDQTQILKLLNSVQYSSGGDYVDALGDALDHAASRVQWRPAARKLLLVVGDSPGHSLLHPIDPSADTKARRADVDEKAIALHELGVEIVTICSILEEAASDPNPTVSCELHLQTSLRQLTRMQYLRLASLPHWAFSINNFDPQSAADALLQPDLLAIARHAAYPLFEPLESESAAEEADTAIPDAALGAAF